MGFKLLDGVELLMDLPGEGLQCGQVGTVVHVFAHSNEAYEVEFVDQDGQTVATLPLLPGQIALHSRTKSSRPAAIEVACKREPDDRPAVEIGHLQRRL